MCITSVHRYIDTTAVCSRLSGCLFWPVSARVPKSFHRNCTFFAPIACHFVYHLQCQAVGKIRRQFKEVEKEESTFAGTAKQVCL